MQLCDNWGDGSVVAEQKNIFFLIQKKMSFLPFPGKLAVN